MALETNSEAYLPVMLSLVRLYARSFWHTLKGGKEGLSLWGDDEEGKSAFLSIDVIRSDLFLSIRRA